jgi:IS30 family transposase
MTLEQLQEITMRKQQIDREWRDAIDALARIHSTRQVAAAAGVGHATIHRQTREWTGMDDNLQAAAIEQETM